MTRERKQHPELKHEIWQYERGADFHSVFHRPGVINQRMGRAKKRRQVVSASCRLIMRYFAGVRGVVVRGVVVRGVVDVAGDGPFAGGAGTPELAL